MEEGSNGNNAKQDICIAKISKDIEFIKFELGEIKNNHLHSINEEIKTLKIKIETLKEQLDARPTWSVTFLVSLTLSLISFLVAHFLVR